VASARSRFRTIQDRRGATAVKPNDLSIRAAIEVTFAADHDRHAAFAMFAHLIE
jgi:hypothetical protein